MLKGWWHDDVLMYVDLREMGNHLKYNEKTLIYRCDLSWLTYLKENSKTKIELIEVIKDKRFTLELLNLITYEIHFQSFLWLNNKLFILWAQKIYKIILFWKCGIITSLFSLFFALLCPLFKVFISSLCFTSYKKLNNKCAK